MNEWIKILKLILNKQNQYLELSVFMLERDLEYEWMIEWMTG